MNWLKKLFLKEEKNETVIMMIPFFRKGGFKGGKS